MMYTIVKTLLQENYKVLLAKPIAKNKGFNH